MPVSTIIRERRKAKGYTQEQVAEYLGVSAPAVNKWERGSSFPDITLLAPLARLLETDLNTLLCFQQELTEKEIGILCNEIVEEIRENGFESGYKKAVQAVRKYPNCGALAGMAAAVLDGSLVLFGTAGGQEQRERHEEEIAGLYERAVRDGEGEGKNRAAFMLAARYMRKEEYEKAREILDMLPERSGIDKRQIEGQILAREKRYEEAQILLEKRLLQQVMEVQQILWGMLEVEMKQGNTGNAERLSGKCERFVKLFELWDYNSFVAPLEMALRSRDTEKSIQVLEEIVKAASTVWDMGASFLYRHLGGQIQASGQEETSGQIQASGQGHAPEQPDGGEQMLHAFAAMLEHDESCAFLHGNEKFERLLERFKEF